MTQNKKIAVTGGIGSGKSAFCNILRKKGYSVLSCDEIYRNLWSNEEYLQGLYALFPECVKNGGIDKASLSAAVFSDKKQLAKLNAYAHPKIMQTLLDNMQGSGVFFAEVPLLFEGGYEDLFDEVIALRRADKSRILSVAERDGLVEAAIIARMQSQFDPAKLSDKACIVVENDGSLLHLEQKAEEVLKKIL